MRERGGRQQEQTRLWTGGAGHGHVWLGKRMIGCITNKGEEGDIKPNEKRNKRRPNTEQASWMALAVVTFTQKQHANLYLHTLKSLHRCRLRSPPFRRYRQNQ